MGGAVTPSEILSELQARQVELVVVGDRLRFRPVTAVPEALREALRIHKAEVMDLVELQGWPEASRDAVRRFRQPCARLYPFIGREIQTPRGLGRLLQVFPERATVAFAASTGDGELLPALGGPAAGRSGRDLTEPRIH